MWKMYSLGLLIEMEKTQGKKIFITNKFKILAADGDFHLYAKIKVVN